VLLLRSAAQRLRTPSLRETGCVTCNRLRCPVSLKEGQRSHPPSKEGKGASATTVIDYILHITDYFTYF